MRGSSRAGDIVDRVTPKLTQEYLRLRQEGQQGEAELSAAWDEFFARCDFAIRCWLSCLNGSSIPPGTLADCVQEVWLQLTRRLIVWRFDPMLSLFRTWLHAFVKKVAADAGRNDRRRLHEHLVAEPSGEDRRCEDPAVACDRLLKISRVRQTLELFEAKVSPLDYSDGSDISEFMPA